MMSWSPHPPLVLAAAVLLASVGCTHMTTRVPGVLDMRSDGSGAPADLTPVVTPPRSSFDALIYGEGVQGTSDITVTDRRYWALRLVPILNESTTEEINTALGTGALRNITIGEQVSAYGIVLGVVGSIVPFLPIILPPGDMKMSGTRVKLNDAPAPGTRG